MLCRRSAKQETQLFGLEERSISASVSEFACHNRRDGAFGDQNIPSADAREKNDDCTAQSSRVSMLHNLRKTCPAKPTLGNQGSPTVLTQPRGNRVAEVQGPKVCMNFDLPPPRCRAIAEAAP